MPRLYRPPTPIKVKCWIALRDLGERAIDAKIEQYHGALGKLLVTLEAKLAEKFGCKVKDLRVDHDPALGVRKKRGEGKKTVYTPDANDPEFLFYRPHGTEFAGSHDVKTRIRGDNGQYSDIVLIKRARRRLHKKSKKKRRVSRLAGRSNWPPRGSRKVQWWN